MMVWLELLLDDSGVSDWLEYPEDEEVEDKGSRGFRRLGGHLQALRGPKIVWVSTVLKVAFAIIGVGC